MAEKWRKTFPATCIWRESGGKCPMRPYPYLEKYRIPHEINLTDKFVGFLMELAEQKPFLEESFGSPLEVQLLRKAKIRAITYSNQIEGNDLQEGQVTALIAGKKVQGEVKDIAEVRNYHLAIGYVETLSSDDRKLGLRDVCDIQKLVTKDQLSFELNGSLRSGPVSIVNSATGKVIEECPPHFDLPYLMEELIRWIEANSSRNPFAVAFGAHFITVAIHPFADGNGRTVRLLQHLLLLKRKEVIAQFIPSETSIMANRERYYQAIRQARELDRLDPFIEFIAECFVIAAKDVVKEARQILKGLSGKTPKARQEKIIKFIKAHPSVSAAEIAGHFPDVPKRTIERDLAVLVKSKVVKGTGSTRARKYS
jgi:Fic family protein